MAHRTWCRVLAVVTFAIPGATLGAAPAIADVTMTPGQAVQGGAAKLTFRVTEDRAPAYTTAIELRMPESAPVAETYPMSVPDWAPRIAMRKVDQALGGLHHGQNTEVVSSIIWTRAGAPKAGGGPAELIISLGPMPQTDQMTFTVLQTYSDGVVTNWDQPPSAEVPRPDRPAPVLTLLPAGSGVVGSDVPEGGPASGGAEADAADPSAAQPGDDGQGFGSLAIGLVIGLLGGLAVAGWLFLRRQRAGTADPRTAGTEDADPETDDAKSAAANAGSADPEDGDPEDGDPAGAGPEPARPRGRDRASSGGRAWRLRE